MVAGMAKLAVDWQ